MRKLSETRSTIDESQAMLNKRYDQVRIIIKTLDDYGITDRDFEQFQSKCSPAYKLAASLEMAKEEDIIEALDLCSVLNSLKQPKRWFFSRRPSDQTTMAMVKRLMKLYWSITETRRNINDSQAMLNRRYDQVRTIMKTLDEYGVTDSDYESINGHQYNSGYKLAATLEMAKEEDIVEALDLCSVLDSLKQPKRWFFSRRPSDQTIKAMVRRLMSLYWLIAG